MTNTIEKKKLEETPEKFPKKSYDDTLDKVKLMVELLEDILAEDIVVLHIDEFTSVSEYIVVASGRSDRHAKAVAESVLKGMSKHKISAIGKEGLQSATWILADFGDIVLHVFQKDFRALYNLEGLWSDAKKVEIERKTS